MAHIGNFNAGDHRPADLKWTPVPKGVYRMMIVQSDVKPTRNGRGSYIELRWEVLEGEMQGRAVLQRITYENESTKAVEFGQRILTTVCMALGKPHIQDTSELHNIPVLAEVDLEDKKDSEFGPQNKIVGFPEPAGAASSTPAPQPSAPAAPRQSPWGAPRG